MSVPIFSSLAFQSDLGRLFLVASEEGLVALAFLAGAEPETIRARLTQELGSPVLDQESGVLRRAMRQIEAYLDQKRKVFALPIDVRGTPFQRRVWDTLSTIPYGETITYAMVAQKIGKPSAVRAVANACGRNPLPLVIPCHRVVASGGGIGGFSSGLALKRRLLSHELSDGTSLPLFTVAKQREVRNSVRAKKEVLLEKMQKPAASWLTAKLDDARVDSKMRAEVWVAQVLEVLDNDELATLAELIACHPMCARDGELADVANELIAASVTLALDEDINALTLLSMLRASAQVAPTWFEVTCHRLIARPQLNDELRMTLRQVLEDIMGGVLPSLSQVRHQAVDIWARLQPDLSGKTWRVIDAEDPSQVYAQAGLWREAAAEAERALAQGEGERIELLERLVTLYTQLDEDEATKDALLRLVAERPDPAYLKKLRVLDDSLSSPSGEE